MRSPAPIRDTNPAAEAATNYGSQRALIAISEPDGYRRVPASPPRSPAEALGEPTVRAAGRQVVRDARTAPPDPALTELRSASQHLLATRLQQLREQTADRTTQAVAAPWTDRLPELAARQLDADASGAMIA